MLVLQGAIHTSNIVHLLRATALSVIAISRCFLFLHRDYVALALSYSCASSTTIDHIVLIILIAWMVLQRNGIFRARSCPPVRSCASHRQWNPTRSFLVIIDRPLVALSALALRHSVVLLGHDSSLSVDHAYWAALTATWHLIERLPRLR